MTESTHKPSERAPEVAVAPLNTIDQQDVGAAAAAFDKWLRKISYDYVTLERLSTVAGSLPVLGNIMALIDAVMDVVGIIQKYIAKKEVEYHRQHIEYSSSKGQFYGLRRIRGYNY
ncbi:hypothetical protein [Pseudoduganella chitinolytica]|uniref:Uncharacterized protein n=1 Tax=Pseudoduganella chitinolytica TaxID=34070 RepID=A0ABY8BDN4_9BURK|nr:hypothetical protein [Pseudoduganella chitinolytica]WEF33103.1 hypothetical protein PX653_27555 [Pseudoduganella chitinolytica]